MMALGVQEAEHLKGQSPAQLSQLARILNDKLDGFRRSRDRTDGALTTLQGVPKADVKWG